MEINPNTIAIIFEAAFGLIIGSFLSVCIYRIPALRDDLDEDPFPDEPKDPESKPVEKPAVEKVQKKKLIEGFNSPKRSICTKCGAQLKWFNNIPVFSWIFQGGKCAYCKERISARYPLIEILTAIVSVLSFQIFGPTPTGFLMFVFSSMLIVISFIDYDYYIIPNIITYPGTAIALLLALINHYTHWFTYPVVQTFYDSLIGVTIGGGFFWAFAEGYYLLRKKDGLGMGDVKLLFLIGALFGVFGSFYTIFIGSVFGSILGVLLIILGGRRWSKPLPFGPYLAIGAFIYLYFGAELSKWWYGFILPTQF